jgi:hypothetical protein
MPFADGGLADNGDLFGGCRLVLVVEKGVDPVDGGLIFR